MLSNPGQAFQRSAGNTPIAATVSDKITAVVTGSGNVYQAGLVGDNVQSCFQEVRINENIVGHVIDAESTETSTYLLNAYGSVFEYKYNTPECSYLREVYAPTACGGDKAIRIKAGRGHLVILTEGHKVWGVGDNSQYQIVPQGQSHYDTAVEIIVTDTNAHDNESCTAFTGTYTPLKTPVIPSTSTASSVTGLCDSKRDVHLGYINVNPGTVTPPGIAGTISIPVYGDISYSGFLCTDKCGGAAGSVTYSINKLYVKCGCFTSKFTTRVAPDCTVRTFATSSTREIVLFEATGCTSAATNTCGSTTPVVLPIQGTTQVHGRCGSCATINLTIPNTLVLPTVAFDADCSTLIVQLGLDRTTITGLCDTSFTGLETAAVVTLVADYDITLDCCVDTGACTAVVLEQPCWTAIYAGGDNTVLVNNCNRFYVFGSLHNVRSNKNLLKNSCFENLLNQTGASISFPADQLNCAGNRKGRDSECDRDRRHKTDLSKFGVHINLPPVSECGDGMNVCQFINNLKKCNEEVTCSPICEPCDGYIYLNVVGDNHCHRGAPSVENIGSVTIFNKRSVCKLTSQGYPDLRTISADISTTVEYDLNKYCVDTTDVSLDQILKLVFCADGPNVNLFVDIDQAGGVKFVAHSDKCNVEFTANASTENHQFLLNYGGIMDTVVLTNMKYALSLEPTYPCPRFKNPFTTKLTNTYLRGGDHVKFVSTNPKNIRQAVTADIPTIFHLGRRVIDVAIGGNNLTVLVGGLHCPNEIFVLGTNCHGELGTGNLESIVCWKQLNRCQFDCQVSSVYAGRNVTFYRTQSNQIYGAGQWGALVHSTVPCIVKHICQAWRIHHIAVSRTHIVLLGADGAIFGVGDNNMGELGLGNTNCVRKPVPLSFFYRRGKSFDGPCGFNPCGPAVGCGPVGFNPCGPVNPCDFDNGCGPRNKGYNPNARVFPKYNRF